MSETIPLIMQGVYLLGDRKCEVRTVRIPDVGCGQVLVEMRASGICGSDLRAIYRPKTHKTDAEGYLGVIAGHEPAGIIVKRGDGVSDRWKEGTRVVIYHIQGCGICHDCRKGQYISCTSPERKAYGWQRDGGHGDYLLADQQSLVLLPDSLTYLDGAIVACGLGTAYAACERAQISGKDHVVVTGLGPVGLGVALLAKNLGASVLGLELDEQRRSIAQALGIECMPGSDHNPDSSLHHISDWTAAKGADVAIDCSGNSQARNLCIQAVRSWGCVVFVGEGGSVTFEVSPWVIHKSLTMYGSWVCSIGQMEELMNHLVKWKFHPETIVTNMFTLNNAPEAYQLFDTGASGKCILVYKGETKQHTLP